MAIWHVDTDDGSEGYYLQADSEAEALCVARRQYYVEWYLSDEHIARTRRDADQYYGGDLNALLDETIATDGGIIELTARQVSEAEYEALGRPLGRHN